MGTEALEFLQGEQSVLDRIQEDDMIRRNQRPKTPSQAPTLTTASFQLSDGATAASVDVAWTPTRKDMDYIVRWKKTSDAAGSYTYERAKISPYVLRPLETSTEIHVAFALERRQYGTRGQFSEDAVITTAADTTAPSDPIILSLTVNNITGTISLTWTPVTASDLDHYELQRGTSSGSETQLALVGGTSYEDFNVTPGVTYYYRVRAVDRSGNNGSFSNEVNGTVAFVGTISATPEATCITDPGNTYTTAVTQNINIPAGSKRFTLQLTVASNSIVGGAGSVTVKFSVGSVGSNDSNEATLNFTIAAQNRTATLQSQSDLGVSGVQSIFYQWKDAEGDTSSYQLTSPGSIQVTAS